MILLFFLYLLSAKAASPPHENGDNISSSCTTLGHCRTLWDIVWSSLTTIGLCTWGALHPNIPSQFPDDEEEPIGYWRTKKCWISRMKRCQRIIRVFMKERVLLFLVAFLVPEYILAWAIRQNLQARKIVKKGFKKDQYDLTVTQIHGFFIVMGGFQLYKIRVIEKDNGEGGRKRQELGEPLHPLNFIHPSSDGYREDDQHNNLWHLVHEGKVDLPTVQEIQDRGKSDWLAKTLVIFQTLWFVMQCIARGIEHLPITELEIIALAYTTINIGIYIAWWNKPRGINHPIRVFREKGEEVEAVENNLDGDQENAAAKDESVDRIEGGIDEQDSSNWDKITDFLSMILEWTLDAIEVIATYTAGGQDDDVVLDKRTGVPIFWSGNPSAKTILISDSLALLVGILFGAVHCIAWSFQFPSHRITVLWRLSAAVIAGIPLIISTLASIIGSILYIGDEVSAPEWWEKGWEHISDWIDRFTDHRIGYWIGSVVVVILVVIAAIPIVIIVVGFVVSCFLYVVARGATLVIALITLKSLPPGAYQTVQWTTFIPHI